MADHRKELQLLEKIILQLIKEEKYEQGLRITRDNLAKPKFEANIEAIAILNELTMKLKQLVGDMVSALENAMLSWNFGDSRFKFSDSYLLAGQICQYNNELDLAIEIYQQGMNCVEEEDVKSECRTKVSEIETFRKERSDKAASELLASEAPPESSKKKINNKKSQKGTKDDVKAKGKMPEDQLLKNENTEKEGEDKLTTENEDKGELKDRKNEECQDVQRIVFDVPLKVTLESQSGDYENYCGTICCDFVDLPKSFLSPTSLQVKNFSQLQSLGSSSPYLLSVEYVITHPHHHCHLLVSEPVFNIDHYFKNILQQFSHSLSEVSEQAWWNHISTKFLLIFRDVSQGLLFLYKDNKTCGNLGFNIFVTPNGRGRLLPSLDTTLKGVQDVKDFLSKMKTIISFPFCQESSSVMSFHNFGLPQELSHLFSFVPSFLGSMPPSFLIDHPYFWTTAERIDFIPKLNKLLRKSKNNGLQRRLEDLHGTPYKSWHTRLDGVYHQVWCKGDPNRETRDKNLEIRDLPSNAILVKIYSKEADIVRFFGAAYRHVNDREYKSHRQKELTEDEIERDLIKTFPRFYVDMFSCICSWVQDVTECLDSDLLQLVSSRYYRDEALSLPQIMEKEPVCILVANATSDFIDALLPLIVGGVMFGERQPVILHLFDDDDVSVEVLKRVKVDLKSAGYPLLRDIIIVDKEVIKACKGVNFAILCDGFSYQNNAYALAHAAENCKVLVVSGNAHINASIVHKKAPCVDPKNITFLTGKVEVGDIRDWVLGTPKGLQGMISRGYGTPLDSHLST